MMFGRNSWWKGVSESCKAFEIQCNFCDIVSGLQWAESSPLSSCEESCSCYCQTMRRTKPTARGPQEMLTASHPAVPCWAPSCRRISFREVEGNHPSTWPYVTPPAWPGQRKVLYCMPCCWNTGMKLHLICCPMGAVCQAGHTGTAQYQTSM